MSAKEKLFVSRVCQGIDSSNHRSVLHSKNSVVIAQKSHCKQTEPEKTAGNDCSLTVMNNTDENILRENNSVLEFYINIHPQVQLYNTFRP